MATYKKPTIEVSVATLMGYTFQGKGDVFGAFKAHKTVEAKDGDGNTVFIPFHAVQMLMPAVTAADATKADPYCE